MEDKKTGSYYTPVEVVRFMVSYLSAQGQAFNQVLEPAAGDGRFLPVLLENPGCHIDAVELYKEKIDDMRGRIRSENVGYILSDFVELVQTHEKKYDLIIGNPPYISIKNMEDEAVEKSRLLFEQVELNRSIMQNLWCAFLVGAVQLLSEKGTIFFVLPAEFLQVQYAEKLRLYLEEHFNNIKIFTFEENIFPEIEQHTCLVYLSNSDCAPPYIDYYLYKTPKHSSPLKQSRIEKSKPLKKWSNALLSDTEIQLLQNADANCITIGQLGACAPGIVTGGNKYFIVKPSFVAENRAEDYVLPIIQKNSMIKAETIFFDDALFNSLREADSPMYLLNLAGRKDIPPGVIRYLTEKGDEKTNDIALKDRHKCSNRTPWYAVPIVNYGDVVFFKRTDRLPRFYINQKQVHTTDAAYHIRLLDAYDAASVVFCFYNSLTLALCEFCGRYYGGGVLELVPAEFKALKLPYTRIKSADIDALNQMFRSGRSSQEIINFVDSKTLVNHISKKEIEHIKQIRKKLMNRRLG